MSKKLIEPYTVKWNKDRYTSTLFFDDDKSLAQTGEYLVRGGVCFPVVTDKSIKGYAVLCGMNMSDKTVYLFNEREFVVIDHVIEANRVEYHGISVWFNEMWSKYFADTYFYRQDYDVSKKYQNQIIRSDMIEPKPRFVQSKNKDEDQSMHTLYEKDITGKFRYSAGQVWEEMQLYDKNDKAVYPALHALQCCLNGFDKYFI